MNLRCRTSLSRQKETLWKLDFQRVLRALEDSNFLHMHENRIERGIPPPYPSNVTTKSQQFLPLLL